MKQLALLALADAEVDLLTRFANRSDLTLSAVYHPDPHSLLARLAELADVPVYTDLALLAELPLDCCVGGERSRSLLDTLSGRAAALGRAAPQFVPLDEADRFLDDPAEWRPEGDAAAIEAAPVEAAVAPTPLETSVEVAPPVAESDVSEAPPVTAPAEVAAAAAPPEPEAAPEPVAATAPAESPSAPAAVEARPAETPVASDEHEPPSRPGPSRRTLGSPTIDLFYDPARLAEWLATSALALAGADAAVVWRREGEGRRWSLMAFAPDPDRLPAVTFPPEELEQQVQSGLLHVGPLSDGAGGNLEPPVRALYVPLPGSAEPFGLLALFQPWDAPDWPKGVREELSAHASELGLALERCVQLSKVGLELKHLKFKERLRDLLLDDALDMTARWRQCLEFLLVELPATSVWYFAAEEGGRRLQLVAATSTAGPIQGHLSLPVGTGLIGGAFGGAARASWFCEAADGSGEIVTIPVDGGRGGQRAATGVLLIEGVPPADDEPRDAERRVDLLRDILAPLVPPTSAG